MGILSFEKPEKLRPFKAHAERYSSDSGIAGTYVPNMSKADMAKWKAKHIKGANERIEIRKSSHGTQILIIVYKEARESGWEDESRSKWLYGHENVQISANGKIQFSFAEWQEMVQAIEEAKAILLP